MKRTLCLLLVLMMSLAAIAGLAEAQAPAPIRVGALKGPTAMGLVKLMQEDEGTGAYAFTLAASPDVLVPSLIKGELDLACLPVNLAAILYANTKGAIKVVNVNTLGVLYLVENGNTISSLQDLSGRTLYASGMSSTPEYVLNHLLKLANVLDVNISWKAEHTEALTALLADPQGVAMLPQPFVTVAQTKNPDIRIAVDLNAEWEKLGEGSLITGVTVARAEWLEKNPEALAAFLASYEASAKFVQENHEEAAKLIGGYDIINEQVALKALPYCGITFVKGQDMQTLLTPFYQMLFDQNPAATSGSLPDEAFYHLP